MGGDTTDYLTRLRWTRFASKFFGAYIDYLTGAGLTGVPGSAGAHSGPGGPFLPVMVGEGRPSTSFCGAGNEKQIVDGRPSPTMTGGVWAVSMPAATRRRPRPRSAPDSRPSSNRYKPQFFCRPERCRKLMKWPMLVFLAIFASANPAPGSDGAANDRHGSKAAIEKEVFIHAFIDTVFPTLRPTELVRRRREDIAIVVRGNVNFEISQYLESAINTISKLMPYDVSVRKGGDVDTVLLFTDDVRRDSFGVLRNVIRQTLLPGQTVEDAFRKNGNSRCLIITPGHEDRVLGVLMVLSNNALDTGYVKFCIKSGLVRSLGLIGRRAYNTLRRDERLFHISDQDKKILEALYSKALDGKDLKGAVRVLRKEDIKLPSLNIDSK